MTATCVTFDATAGTANTSVTLSGSLAPGGLVTVTGSNAYTFNGPGAIGGATMLVVNGGASLTLNNTNSYSLGTAIASGQITLARPTPCRPRAT